jgi:opacity protein-like surface antigen
LKASILASANLSDSVHAEIAYGYADGEGHLSRTIAPNWDYQGDVDSKTHAVLAGIYYDPVSQLTIGLEGEWYQTKWSGDDDHVTASDPFLMEYSAKGTSWQVDLVTVFRF